ncbi:hypothetical protein [Roseospira goensis]|uniref:Uncharacterized protein n=1 Tax=Roseospira goensis TaxID=391922 RepID=A0A7W6WJ99_9PROT|nr:hypothetical protein [Roseospira goensis]MBB4284971.1 hypothetical protein [Roseospira goensis]
MVADFDGGVLTSDAGALLLGATDRATRTVTPYTVRRSMARLLRARGVPMADTAAWLGHSLRGMATTEEYADVDPTFLHVPRGVIDDLAAEIDGHMTGPRRLDATKLRPKETATNVLTLAAVPKTRAASGS